MQNNETTPKHVRYVEHILQEMKTTKTERIWNMTQNKPIYDELSLNLEAKVNDVQLSWNFWYSAISTQIDRI